ncbi:MAG: hypothetical protein HRF50_13630 [Phycisphaerae bacterium]|jgi:hypothetical protein
MSSQSQPPLSELPHQVREKVENLGGSFKDWKAEVHEDPSKLFRSMPIRIALWVVLGAAALFAVQFAIGLLAPPAASEADLKRSATLYVACTMPKCLETYTVQTDLDFNAWPMSCRRCEQLSVYRAKLCRSCSRWYAVPPGRPDACPRCAAASKPADDKPATSQSTDPDDREDGWGG